MPPVLAGVNALYSLEFYQLAKAKLNPDGVIAQWLPFHAVAPHFAASIAKTFIQVFPHSILWIDPLSKNGILLGKKEHGENNNFNWVGFSRENTKRDLNKKEVVDNVALNTTQLRAYASYGQLISDDNQLLAYGKALYINIGLLKENFKLLHQINSKIDS